MVTKPRVLGDQCCTSGNRTAISPLCVMYRTQGSEGYCNCNTPRQHLKVVLMCGSGHTFGSMIFRYRT